MSAAAKAPPFQARCAVCGRSLSDPVSVQAGIGPVCAAKRAAAEELGLFPIDETRADLPWDPATCDVMCSRDERGTHFNIDQVLVFHSPTGMEWGYGGSGPADFSLNVLARFTDRQRAVVLHQQFKWDFIAKLPREGGMIAGAEIRRWIRDHEEAIETCEGPA